MIPVKSTEIRVRPVIRHIITKHTRDCLGAGLETLGEFDNEGHAEKVAEALKDFYAPKVYALVEETLGEPSALVFYAEDYVLEMRQDELRHRYPDKSFRVYARNKELLAG